MGLLNGQKSLLLDKKLGGRGHTETSKLCHLPGGSVVSDSVTPWLQPARLLCPWDSPGKNIGVGYHALLQKNLPSPGIKPKSPALQADSLPAELLGKPICQVGMLQNSILPECQNKRNENRAWVRMR